MAGFGTGEVRGIQTRQAPKERAAVDRRAVPIGHVNITATSGAAAQNLFTVRPNIGFDIQRLAVVNTAASSVGLSFHTVPAAGALGAGNVELAAQSIPANSAVDLTDLVQGFYEQGTVGRVFASVSGALTIHGWAYEVL